MTKTTPSFVDKLYFAYGSNLHMPQMQRRCPDSAPIAAGILKDYRLTFRGNWRGAGVADVVPCKGAEVVGGLYCVSQDDLGALDRYEGYPTLYDRFDIEVELLDGRVLPAFVYRMLDCYQPAVPSEYYFDVIKTGYRLWGFGPASLLRARNEVSALCEEG